MSKILVVYGSKYGQTKRVAHRIAGILRDAGQAVDIYRGDQLPAPLPLGDYTGFVVAASVLMGHHQRYIRDFVRRHASLLNQAPSAFVSVCGAAGGDPPEARPTSTPCSARRGGARKSPDPLPERWRTRGTHGGSAGT